MAIIKAHEFNKIQVIKLIVFYQKEERYDGKRWGQGGQ